MKAVMVMFDSLNRHMLSPYGCQWTHTPNFARLAQRTVRFDQAYVCSMPCMPARRELHTGRPNFLHRSWGPLEPFDDSMPEILKQAGVYTHLATDHYHYFEDGGATYHSRYNTWEFFRGQEGDRWMGQVAKPTLPERVVNRTDGYAIHDAINRSFMQNEADQPQPQTFRAGIDFIRRNVKEDRWFLQLECFDPHEPFFSHRKHKDHFAEHYRDYKGRQFDWPPYRSSSTETKEEIEHLRYEYASLLAMCDAYLGDVLDLFDELDLWKDTLLIVCTDHGFMLGEKNCYAKCWQPFYQEVAHVPLFIWDPRSGKKNESRQSLVQMIDFAPTLLEYFGVPVPPDMTGKPLRDTIASDAKIRDAAIFGIHGGRVNVTDGHYVYMRGQVDPDRPVYEYTLMPTGMRSPFSVKLMQENIALAPPMPFTKGLATMKIKTAARPSSNQPGVGQATMLFDLGNDPRQESPLEDRQVEDRMIAHLRREMQAVDAPPEQFARLGL